MIDSSLLFIILALIVTFIITINANMKLNIFKSKTHQFIIIFMLVFLAVKYVFQTPLVQNTFFSYVDKSMGVKLRLSKLREEVYNLPSYATYRGSHPQVDIQVLFSRGLKRLNFSQLKIFNELRIKLSEKSVALCAGFWRGGTDGKIFVDGLAALAPKDLDSWLSIYRLAVLMELDQEYFPAVGAEDLKAGLNIIMESSNDIDKKRLNNLLASISNASSADACWCMKKILNNQHLEVSVREKFLRSLVYIL